MTARFQRLNPCDNMNHRRRNAPVGYCPQCGGIVNEGIRAQPCSETQHAVARRHHSFFCVHCGVQLIFNH
jgi:hypothetical protein